MNKRLHVLVLAVCLAFSATAQLDHPMDFVINTPANIAGNYDYGEPTDWGPTSINTTCGDLAWGYTAAGDSLGCDSIVTDLTGKIAVISRGLCNFSLKAYHAQQAGAIGTIIINADVNPANELVGMLGGDSMSAVTTPSVFLSYGSGGPIMAEVDAGNPVNACFKVPTITDAQGIIHYNTPNTQIYALDSFWLTINNGGSLDETNVTISVDVTDPSGTVSNFNRNIGTLTANTQQEFGVLSGFLPTANGTYNVKFKVSSDSPTYDTDSVLQSFNINDYTFGNHSDNLVGAITPSDFATVFRSDVGNYYYTANAGIATHGAFMLEDVSAMHGESFNVILFDVDQNLDGQVDGTDYTDFGATAFNSIIIDSTIHQDNMPIIIDLLSNDPNSPAVSLVANGIYLLSIQYDANTSVNGNVDPPSYVHSSAVGYRFRNTAVYTDQLYGGWSGGWQAVVDLHLDGFVVGTKNVKILNDVAFGVYPNPATDFVTLDFNLEEMANNVNVKILDVQGRVVENYNYGNIKNDKFTYNVNQLATGNYFIRVETENGFRTKHFIIAK